MAKRKLGSVSDIGQVTTEHTDKTKKKLDEGERKTNNLEVLFREAEKLVGNLPAQEQEALQNSIQNAYEQGMNDFRKTEQEMKDHLEEEGETRDDFGEAKKDTGDDVQKVEGAIRETKRAPFQEELQSARSMLKQVENTFRKSEETLKKDVKDGRKELGKKAERVKRARPRMNLKR
jgi:hypothetical protein